MQNTLIKTWQFFSLFKRYWSHLDMEFGPKYLHLPKSVDEMSQFEVKFGIPRAIDAIDRNHIPIQRPTENSQDLFNYKGFFFNIIMS